MQLPARRNGTDLRCPRGHGQPTASWIGIAGTESLSWLKRLLPGGSATELVIDAWNGGVPVADSLLLLLPTFGWVVVSVALAARFFRWEPRR
ncbi:hypothetical protein [Modestobacter italicus]|uniref:hypothetical protein n=1 Tax=Modestobacter italicus (strain DSM 44449 / CECT 9708 / BC 501) TaxID=2732864 RepID=UPI0002E432E7|nr:hypothetical protein [Modestobacter marinus]